MNYRELWSLYLDVTGLPDDTPADTVFDALDAHGESVVLPVLFGKADEVRPARLGAGSYAALRVYVQNRLRRTYSPDPEQWEVALTAHFPFDAHTPFVIGENGEAAYLEVWEVQALTEALRANPHSLKPW